MMSKNPSKTNSLENGGKWRVMSPANIQKCFCKKKVFHKFNIQPQILSKLFRYFRKHLLRIPL